MNQIEMEDSGSNFVMCLDPTKNQPPQNQEEEKKKTTNDNGWFWLPKKKKKPVGYRHRIDMSSPF
jgi:hypothetical protein